jgi:hypothetical protein
MGISRQCASKRVGRYRRYGGPGLLDRPSAPHHQPTAATGQIVARIEQLRRDHKYSTRRISTELAGEGMTISVRTVSRLRHAAWRGCGATSNPPRSWPRQHRVCVHRTRVVMCRHRPHAARSARTGEFPSAPQERVRLSGAGGCGPESRVPRTGSRERAPWKSRPDCGPPSWT